MIDKTEMILKLEENFHTTGPNIGNSNFSLVEKLYLNVIETIRYRV